MHVVFGNKELFALEVVPTRDDSEQDYWRFVHVRFWVNGQPLGDFTEAEARGVLCASLKNLIVSRGNRSHPVLFELPAPDFFGLAHRKLYGDGDDDADAAWESFGRYRATDIGIDSFRRWEAYLVEDSEQARYVWAEGEPTLRKVYEAYLPAGEFDRIVALAVNKLEAK